MPNDRHSGKEEKRASVSEAEILQAFRRADRLMEMPCKGCGTLEGDRHETMDGDALCSRCVFIEMMGGAMDEAALHPDCPPLPRDVRPSRSLSAERQCAPDQPTPEVGSVVVMTGLKKQPQHNGRYAVIQDNVVQEGPSKGRIPVMPYKGATTLALKPENMKRLEGSGTHYQNVMFWPKLSNRRAKRGAKHIIVNALDDWPQDWTYEKKYLIERHGWTQPELLSGIKSRGQIKPDFQMYYDAADATSPMNDVAQGIAKRLPPHEHYKCPNPKSGYYRGPCILCYSPTTTTSTFFGSDAISGRTVSQSAPKNKLWTIFEMKDVLGFASGGE